MPHACRECILIAAFCRSVMPFSGVSPSLHLTQFPHQQSFPRPESAPPGWRVSGGHSQPGHTRKSLWWRAAGLVGVPPRGPAK